MKHFFKYPILTPFDSNDFVPVKQVTQLYNKPNVTKRNLKINK